MGGDPKEKKDEIWQAMLKATAEGMPMGAGSRAKPEDADEAAFNKQLSGIPATHQYSLFKAYEDGGKKIVDLFNPHGENTYDGSLEKKDHNEGYFSMTYDEFCEAMDGIEIASVKAGYHAASSQIKKQESNGPIVGVLEFTVGSSKPFYASVTWPMNKFFPESCDNEVKMPTEQKIHVLKKDEVGSEKPASLRGREEQVAENACAAVNSITTQVNSGPGTYVVYASVEYNNDFVQNAFVTIYSADKDAKLQESDTSVGDFAKSLGSDDDDDDEGSGGEDERLYSAENAGSVQSITRGGAHFTIIAGCIAAMGAISTVLACLVRRGTTMSYGSVAPVAAESTSLGLDKPVMQPLVPDAHGQVE